MKTNIIWPTTNDRFEYSNTNINWFAKNTKFLAAFVKQWREKYIQKQYKSHSQMFQKVESGGGPIFKVVLEC